MSPPSLVGVPSELDPLVESELELELELEVALLYITVLAVAFSEMVSSAVEVPSSTVIFVFALHPLYLSFPAKSTVTS